MEVQDRLYMYVVEEYQHFLQPTKEAISYLNQLWMWLLQYLSCIKFDYEVIFFVVLGYDVNKNSLFFFYVSVMFQAFLKTCY